MWNYQILSSYFVNRIGFKQTIDPCVPKIHPSLLTGNVFVPNVKDCGLYLKNDMVYNLVNDFNPTLQRRFPVYDPLQSYNVGDRVQYDDGTNNFVYVASQGGNVGNTPAFDSAFWETDLSYYYRSMFEIAINEKIPQVITLNNSEKNLRDEIAYSPLLQENTQPQIQIPYTEDTFFTISVRMDSLRNNKFTVKSIGLRVEQAQTIPIYLYHSSQPDAIKVVNITVTPSQAGRFNWHELSEPFELWYYSSDVNASGVWMIGFYQSDIIGDYYITRVAFKPTAFEKMPFNANAGTLSESNLNKPLVPDVGYSYGGIAPCPDFPLNIRYSVGFDYTYMVIDAAQQFDKLLQYEIAYRIISDMALSSRISNDKSVMLSNINKILSGSYLENGTNVTKGLANYIIELEQQIKLNVGYLGGAPFQYIFG